MPLVAANPVMKAELTTTYMSQVFLNVFWYIRVGGVTPTYSIWHTDFSGIVVSLINLAQTASADMPNLGVVDVNTTDVPFEADPGFGAGPVAGEDLSPFNAAAIRLIRSTNETRHGHKRLFVGTEASMAGGAWTVAFNAQLTALANILGADIVADGVPWSPVILRRFTTADPPVLLPVPSWTYNLVNGAALNPNVSTQNTRKFGRGQ